MPALGPIDPTSVAAAAYGAVPWTNPDGFRVRHYGQATAVIPQGQATEYARAAFDCSALPAGVTLAGILLEWQVGSPYVVTNYPGDASVRLEIGGVPMGDDKARPAETWGVALRYRAYGGPADLWGSGLAADDVRVNGLVALFAARWRAAGDDQPTVGARAQGDHCRLTLYYS